MSEENKTNSTGENENNESGSLIDKSELASLDAKDTARIKLLNLIGVLIGLIALMVVHDVYSIFKMATDESLPQVMCPRSFDLDRPVILKTLSKAAPKDMDNLIKGFALTFTNRMFPRTPEDAEPFFQYVANHTEGLFKKKYEARIKDIKKIKDSIAVGNYSKFHVANSQDIKIRKLSGGNSWVVILKGYLSKRKIGRMEKTQPTIEMTIRYVGAKKSNPEGFVVDSIMFKHIVDPISGEQIEL